MFTVETTMGDVQTLVRQNPLFASLLQNVTLLRVVREQGAELDKLRSPEIADADPGKN